MPRTLPAGAQAWLAKRGGTLSPVVLLDIQTIDGTQYFWSDMEGKYPSRFTGANQFYNGWIKSGCSFTCTRDLSTNAGDLILQNLSGNSINRDVSLAVKSHEFEGALAITRLWLPLLDAAIKEFHCYLTEQNMREDEVEFREGQLFDPAQYFVASDIETTECTWRYKSLMCGSTGTATSCNKTLVACQDATRAAQERFNAILTTIANTVNVPGVNIIGGAGGSLGDYSGALSGGVRRPNDPGPLRG